MSTWQAIEARKARRATAAALVQAQTRADETQQVLDFIVKDIIGGISSAEHPGTADPPSVDVLEKAGATTTARVSRAVRSSRPAVRWLWPTLISSSASFDRPSRTSRVPSISARTTLGPSTPIRSR